VAIRVVGILVGRENVIDEVCHDTSALVTFTRAGYAAATLDLTEHIPLATGSSLQELAHLALEALTVTLPEHHHHIIDEGFWYVLVLSEEVVPALADVEMRSARSFDFAVSWDGAVVRADAGGRAMAEQTITRALLHWYAVGSLGDQARLASTSGDGADHRRIRRDLEQATLLLDPRIDVYWEDEHDLLDALRTAWRTTEMEALTTKVVGSLEYLISSRRARRLEAIFLFLTLTSVVAALPVLIDFIVSDSPSVPRNVVRVVIGALLTATSLGTWWRLRER
jgi:hypothetical protein